MNTASLVSVIRDGIATQNRETALVSCHRGWDGDIDQDTIAQGVMERYRALGRAYAVEGGVAFRRTGLGNVALVRLGALDLELEVISLRQGVVRVVDHDTFHSHEVSDITAWMQEHVYH